ncbi:MAG: nuclear transport factor 2 family protein [Pseudomonadota bacterium]
MVDPDSARIQERLDEVFDAWSVGDAGFNPDTIGPVYENSPEFSAFDTLMPTTSVMNGWETFAQHWTGALNVLKDFKCWTTDVLETTVSGDVAWTRLVLGVSALNSATGERLSGDQQVTLIWRKTDDWRIVHEHLSGPVRYEEGA